MSQSPDGWVTLNDASICHRCKRERTKEGHDPCIAKLPGVNSACCGHGQKRGYVQFTDGRTIYFTDFYVSQ